MKEYFFNRRKFLKTINSLSTLFVLAVMLSANAAAQNEMQCAIRGKVVDDTGKTVADSYLHCYPKYGGGIDFISVSGKSDENGNFEYREGCPAGNLTLYVTSSLTFQNYTPILPPFAYGSKLDKKTKGLEIKQNKKGDVDLGNVPVQIVYSTVSVHFADVSGDSLFSDKKDWENVLIRLKDKSGKLFSEKNIASVEIEKAVSISDSVLTFDLPVEDWLIEMKLDKNDKKWLKADRMIQLGKTADPVGISLRMLKKK